MRKSKPANRTNGSPNGLETKKRHAGWEREDFQESSPGMYSYTARTAFRDPKTGRRLPASVGIVVSEGSVMIWVKT